MIKDLSPISIPAGLLQYAHSKRGLAKLLETIKRDPTGEPLGRILRLNPLILFLPRSVFGEEINWGREAFELSDCLQEGSSEAFYPLFSI